MNDDDDANQTSPAYELKDELARMSPGLPTSRHETVIEPEARVR